MKTIKMYPVRSDYETFVKTTADAMGKIVGKPPPKPNIRLLLLTGLG